jgi:hypothetical protein
MNSFSHYRVIIGFLNKKIILIICLLGIVISILDLFFYSQLTRFITNNEHNVNTIFVSNVSQKKIIIFFLLIMCIKNLLYILNLRFVRGYANDLEIKISNLVNERNVNQYLRFDYNNKNTEIKEDIFYNLYIVKFINNVFSPLVKLFPEIFISIGIIVYTLIEFPRYFLITFFLVLFFVPVINFFAKKSSSINKKIIGNLFNFTEIIRHTVNNRESYVINRQNKKIKEKAFDILYSNKTLWQTIISYNNLNRPIVEFLLLTIIIILVYFNNLDSGFQIFFVVILRLSQQIISISTNFSAVNNNKEITAKILVYTTIPSSSSRKLLIPVFDQLSIKKFQSILNNHNGLLVIKGKSGIGKSTAFKIATHDKLFYCKLQDNIHKFTFNGFYFISQTPVLYRSIKDDLILHNIDINHFSDFLISNEFNYFTELFCNQNISGGQLILFNILKYYYLYKNSNFIFDEPTNGLDLDSKHLLIKLINNHSKNHVCIVITHDSFFDNFESLTIKSNSIVSL